MFRLYYKLIPLFILIFLANINTSFSKTISEIKIDGNQRIPDATILMFSAISISDDITSDTINDVLKNLYDTNFFKDISVSLSSDKLIISVQENPVIENMYYEGVKSKTLQKNILKNTKLKARSSYNEFLLKKDKNSMLAALKNYGYYEPKIEIFIENLSDEKVNISYKINIGDKAKIKKIF